MEIVISFLVTVAAGVTCHLICKWLDRHDRDNKQPSGRSTTEIKREEPSNVLAVHPGARSLFTWNIVISFLPTGIIAYADQEINMQVILKHSETNKKLLFTHHCPARCFGMNMPKSRDIQAKIPLPQANWNEFWLRYCERSEQ